MNIIRRMKLPGSQERCRGTRVDSHRGRKVFCCAPGRWMAAADELKLERLVGRRLLMLDLMARDLSPLLSSIRSYAGRLSCQRRQHLHCHHLPATKICHQLKIYIVNIIISRCIVYIMSKSRKWSRFAEWVAQDAGGYSWNYCQLTMSTKPPHFRQKIEQNNTSTICMLNVFIVV